MAGLWVGRSVGVLPPWGVIAVATPWSLGTQPPLAMWALTSIADPNLVLYKNNNEKLYVPMLTGST